MRQITIRYEGDCRRCGKALEIGQQAFYEKSTGCFCVGCEPKDTEEIRHYRKLKAQKKAERLINKADRLEREAEQKMSVFNSFRGDTAFMTQPGHIPGRDRIIKRYDKGHELLAEARQARDRAENVQKVRVAGDAERKRDRIRQAMDQRVQKGSRVYDFCFGDGTIVSVHKKSYRIKFDRSGSTWARDKSYVRAL
jgi:hypothetical protein